MAAASSLSVGALPCHVTPRRKSNSRVAFIEEEVGVDEETTDEEESFSEKKLQAGGEEGEDPTATTGFLKAKNASDAYFIAHGKAHPTSKDLLSERKSSLKLPLSVADYLESFDPEPLRSVETKWKQWTIELLEGYSLLFYGVGSKRTTLNEFVNHHLVGQLGWDGLVVNGFQTGADLSSILAELEDIVRSSSSEEEEDDDDHREVKKHHFQKKVSSLELMESRARHLCTLLGSKSSKLPRCVVLIHNLDGVGLRSPRVQTILSLLAAQPSIHLVASIDHIYAPILLPSHIASASPYVKDPSHSLQTFPSNYNFLYHHLPTPTPYTLESLLSGTVSTVLPSTIFPPTMIGSQNVKSDIAQNGVTTAKATLHVLSSLTDKAKSLFRILAEYQISQQQSLPATEASRIDESITKGGGQTTSDSEEGGRAPRIAIPGKKLFELARSEFVASFLTQMQALLVEFRDHSIVKAGSSPLQLVDVDESVEDDDEWLWIALSLKDLQHVLANLDDL